MAQNKLAAQSRYFQYLESKGKMPKNSSEEEGYAFGGEVEDETNDESEYDSAGEPHTEDKLEDEQPMEYMSHGGRVKRMFKGGAVSNSSFAKALRKAV